MTEMIEAYGVLVALGQQNGKIKLTKVDPYSKIIVSFLVVFANYAKASKDREAYEMLGTFVMIMAFNSPKDII